MKYCRYCAFCSEVDSGYYCSEKERIMSESKIKRVNSCKDYAYTDIGDVINPGKQYKPRQKKNKVIHGDYGTQIEL